MTSNPLENPLYYLHNFQQVLAWLKLRYADVLSPEERSFIDDFSALAQPSQALLVRMIMRKGCHFRTSRLVYEEIGDTRAAVAPLVRLGWVDEQAPLTLEELFNLLQKAEILQVFRAQIEQPKARKSDWLAALAPLFDEPRSLGQWCPDLEDGVCSLTVMTLCDRLRLMFFGNLHQDWSEFVLADLGIFTYEKVEFRDDARALRSRADVEGFLYLEDCRQHFENGAALDEVLASIQAFASDNPWLQRRRAKLLFLLGQHCERLAEWPLAAAIYQACADPGARARLIRVFERSGDYPQALALAEAAVLAPHNAAEQQQLLRLLPRLRRKLGGPATPRGGTQPTLRLDLSLPRVDPALSVEFHVQAHLHEEQAPVHYVENSLINSLFGLLCWPAIFAPLPGAFFHPFQRGPADLLSEDFHSRRAELFQACLAELDDGRYAQTIRQRYLDKWGVQSPFVFWGALDEELLEQALACLPAEHLKHWFERLLQDIKANRAGMPDLIQFWPQQKTYRMIEVKGPGDRLQDNQLRWLEFCRQHQMPVAVCYVQWAEQDG
ncbi:VRR-NUC domain-containing protein [Pseudomonas sp. LAMO17WK12:I10]|uniref:VRR-NUC domain-containing protein n=1 Tax=unclassified Pseudomonas TaxID=196821 RepID=UPI000BD7FAA9|nr:MULTISPECIES: VRR-NUC domain-containing protein [unclassified Pseudomonas]PXX52313.1 VRR-NUC domain-containing protein [Pseudomonas sp. LAMO17WK12:I9]SNY53069.1 VRR-NUC domain-containing protein [Pseudomonas sp. LAMO17WK12:I10]